MEYWIIQIKPFSPKKRNENIVLNFQKDCIRNNLFGMGWNIDDNAYPAGEPDTAFPGRDQPRQLPKYRVTSGCTVPFQDAVSFFYILIKIIGRKSRMYRLCISGSILLSHSFVLIFVHGFFVF